MLGDILKIIFITMLVFVLITLIILLVYVNKLIKIRTKLKAKTYSDFNQYSEKGQIVFLGDSLTEFYAVDEFFHNLKPYNRGIASDTTYGVLSRLEYNVINMEPEKVFLQIGTNDLGYKKTADFRKVFENIQIIIKNLQEKLVSVRIYLISLYPVNSKAKFYSRMFTKRRNNETIMELNRMLFEYCKDNNITYIDVYSHLADESNNLKKEFTPEGLHINFGGYQVITEILRPFVEE